MVVRLLDCEVVVICYFIVLVEDVMFRIWLIEWLVFGKVGVLMFEVLCIVVLKCWLVNFDLIDVIEYVLW